MEITINITNLDQLIELIRDLAGKISPVGPIPPVIPEPVTLAADPAPQATQPVVQTTQPTTVTQPAAPAPIKAFWCDSCHRVAMERANPGVCKCGCTQMHESVSMAAAQAAINKKATPAPAPVTQAAQPAVTPAAQTVMPQQPGLPTVSKTYTFDDLAAAATKLIRTNPAVRENLKELNSALGIASLKELPAECFGEYAMKLRGMGADI